MASPVVIPSVPPPKPSPPPPAPPRERSLFETFHKWVQTVGIIIAATWGVYTFIYKEIKVPKSAPINISMNMQLKKAGGTSTVGSLLAVEMRVSATNLSPRKVYLLSSFWHVMGYKVTPKEPESDDSFLKGTISLMNARLGQYDLKHTATSPGNIVAAGSLFRDKWLNPNETIMRTIVFYVPHNEYDNLLAQTTMPSVEVNHGVELEYVFEKSDLNSTLYLVNDRNERQVMPADAEGKYPEQVASKLGWQVAYSSAVISLWE